MLIRNRTHERGRRRMAPMALLASAVVVTPLAFVAVTGTGATDVVTDEVVPLASATLPTDDREVPLADAKPATGSFADVAGGAAEVKEITSDTPFSMVGITWEGDYPSATARVRAKETDGSWGPWYDADALETRPADEVAVAGRGGTEPVWLGVDTTAVQVALSGVPFEATNLDDDAPASTDESAGSADADSGEASDSTEAAETSGADSSGAASNADTPAAGAQSDIAGQREDDTADAGDSDTAADQQSSDSAPPVRFADVKPVVQSSDTSPKVVLLTPDSTPTPEAVDVAEFADIAGGEFADIAVPRPNFIPRTSWGVSGGNRCGRQSVDSNISAAVVHHTAGSNNYTQAQSAGIVRGIWQYHTGNLGWCDVGYHAMVDKYGQAFEGIYNGLTRAVRGAHTGGFNGNTFGISMMGDHSSVAPSNATIDQMGKAIGWRLALARVDPKGSDTHYSEGTSFTFVPRGQSVRLPNIFAHRDVGTTTCPGNSGYAQMNRIRDIAKTTYDRGGGTGGGGGNTDPGYNPPAPSNPPRPGTPTAPNPTAPSEGSAGLNLDSATVRKILTTVVGAAIGGQPIDMGTLQTIGGQLLGQVDVGQLLGMITGRSGQLGNLSKLAAQGDDLQSIVAVAGPLLNAANGGDIGAAWSALQGAAGPLGNALSGVQRFGDVSYAKFENGAIYHSDDTGAHPVWGAIGDTWAAQGFEHGPLGLPVEAESKDSSTGVVSQKFENGTLEFDPATGELTAEPNS